MRLHPYSLIGFLAGLALGGFLAVRPSDITSQEPTSSGRVHHELLLAAAQRTEPKVAPIAPVSGRALAVERLASIKRLNAVLHYKFFVRFMSDAFVSEDFVQVYGLSIQERDSIDAAIAAAEKRLEAMEVRNAVVSLEKDGKVRVEIPPYPKEGGALYDEFLNTLRSTLGEERFAYLQPISGTLDDISTLRCFGLQSSTYVITDSHDNPQHGGMSSGSTWDDQSGARAMAYRADLHWLASNHPELYAKVLATSGWAALPADEIHHWPRRRPVLVPPAK